MFVLPIETAERGVLTRTPSVTITVPSCACEVGVESKRDPEIDDLSGDQHPSAASFSGIESNSGSVPEDVYTTCRSATPVRYRSLEIVSGAAGKRCAPVVVHDRCETTGHAGTGPPTSHSRVGKYTPSEPEKVSNWVTVWSVATGPSTCPTTNCAAAYSDWRVVLGTVRCRG